MIRNAQKLTAALWISSAICGGLPFPQAGRPDNGNYLESGGIKDRGWWSGSQSRMQFQRESVQRFISGEQQTNISSINLPLSFHSPYIIPFLVLFYGIISEDALALVGTDFCRSNRKQRNKEETENV
jgi:hypothetical protein